MSLTRTRAASRYARPLLSQQQSRLGSQSQCRAAGALPHSRRQDALSCLAGRSGNTMRTRIGATAAPGPFGILGAGPRFSSRGNKPSKAGETIDGGDDSAGGEAMFDSDERRSSWQESKYDPALGRYPWEESKDRLAELDDGDQYLDFIDLRLDEREKLFPEGLAGEFQGSLQRAVGKGIPVPIMRRVAAEAVIQSLDGFAAGGADGIEGTSSQKWKEARKALAEGGEQAVADDGIGYDEEEQEAKEQVPREPDLELGDVAAAAAEAEAAAAAEAEAAEAKAAAGSAEAAGDLGEDLQGSAEADTEGVLGSGPIWDEMRALAEAHRKPLKGVQRVSTRRRQRSFLLSGRRGSGKSCVLNHIVQHARSTGWIVLFIPDGRNLVQKGIYCQPSPVFDDLYDLPVQSLKRLKSLREAHGEQLRNIHLKDPEILTRYDGAKTVLEVLERGADNEDLAGTVHYDVMRELLATKEAKVLLAIDEYNELFQPSQWHYMDAKLEAPHLTATAHLVPPLKAAVTGLYFADEELQSLAHPARKEQPERMDLDTAARCLPSPPANGIVVCVTSGKYPPIKKLKKNKRWASFEDVAGQLASGVAVKVEPYSRRELLRVVKRYARVDQVVSAPLTDMELAKVHAKSDRLAEKVFDTCRTGVYRIAGPE